MAWNLRKLTPLASASTVVNAEPSTVYEILTDYDNYLEWFPLANHSKLLVKEGDLAIAEFAFERPHDAKLTVECIHTKNEMVLHRRISGNMPVLRLHWTLAPEGSGTRVTLRTVMDFRNRRILYPALLQNFIYRSVLECLKQRVNAFSADIQGEVGRKFLEVIQTDDYLEIWLMGKRYKLTPLEEK